MLLLCVWRLLLLILLFSDNVSRNFPEAYVGSFLKQLLRKGVQMVELRRVWLFRSDRFECLLLLYAASIVDGLIIKQRIILR